MPRPPEIGNVRLYPDRPLKASDKNGYVLKFYCPIQAKRVRKNCGTRDRREADRIMRECRKRLRNGEYVNSGGAITDQQASTRNQIRAVLQNSTDASAMSWQDCYERYRKHYQARSRDKSITDVISRLAISERIMENDRHERGLSEGGPIGDYINLDALEHLQERLLEGDEGKYEMRSPTTVNTTIGAVMAFARYCFRHGWVQSIPPLTKLSVDEVMKGRPISEEEFADMIKATPSVVGERATPSWELILHVLWESGFRIGDCLDFSWDDERHIHPVWPQRQGKHPTLIVPSSQKNRKSQEIPMLPGLQSLLDSVPAERRFGWIIHPVQPENDNSTRRESFRPTSDDLARLTDGYTNSAVARACHVSETAVRKWLDEAGLETGSRQGKVGRSISATESSEIRENAMGVSTWTQCGEEYRPTKEWVGRIISRIGKKAKIVVRREDSSQGKRIKYASAHDIRRGCAQRLINAGVSAETLKLVMRHKDFATTERYYGGTRQAQSAASEIYEKLHSGCKKSELVGGLVGGIEEAPQLSIEELRKLKALLNSI